MGLLGVGLPDPFVRLTIGMNTGTMHVVKAVEEGLSRSLENRIGAK